MAVYPLLKLAVDSLMVLPRNYRSLFHPSLCHAVGIAAEMLANPELSILYYDLGKSWYPGLDKSRVATLHLRLGRRLNSWTYTNGPDFQVFRELAFENLDLAEACFWQEESRQSSYENALESSMLLARSHLRELQAQNEILDFREGQEEEGLSDKQKQNKVSLLYHAERGLLSVQIAVRNK